MKININPDVLSIFLKLKLILGEDVFLVGGYVRDYLLGHDSTDLDFAVSCDPVKVHEIFPQGLYFPKYGTTTIKINDYHITLASMRKENDYLDFRHPGHVEFIKDYKTDALRRDFTINSLYLENSGMILDPTGSGLADLTAKKLCLIGNAQQRLIEDPLRILRAYRFREELSFKFDDELSNAIEHEKGLLSYLKPSKIVEELNKCPSDSKIKIMNELGINI